LNCIEFFVRYVHACFVEPLVAFVTREVRFVRIVRHFTTALRHPLLDWRVESLFGAQHVDAGPHEPGIGLPLELHVKLLHAQDVSAPVHCCSFDLLGVVREEEFVGADECRVAQQGFGLLELPLHFYQHFVHAGLFVFCLHY